MAAASNITYVYLKENILLLQKVRLEKALEEFINKARKFKSLRKSLIGIDVIITDIAKLERELNANQD